jgi:hypothetical protein
MLLPKEETTQIKDHQMQLWFGEEPDWRGVTIKIKDQLMKMNYAVTCMKRSPLKLKNKQFNYDLEKNKTEDS